ncbi:MAG: hypothetical protein V4658_11930, partial [Bacteroidota bacterium]
MIKNVRELENVHIFLWLLKDICWMMNYRTSGMIVAIPTLTMAVYLTLITIKNRPLFLPNLAVLCWISANVSWMIAEFYAVNLIPVSLSLFVSGIIVIAYYFIKSVYTGKTLKPITNSVSQVLNHANLRK